MQLGGRLGELRGKVFHEGLHEIALAQQYELLQMGAVST